tara:strand:+ start:93 stop:407 length:315 start_codon:yes stop_codon:yes gene_type:complete
MNTNTKETQKEIAITILKQMGGVNKLKRFTGAYNFGLRKNGVAFQIRNRKVNTIIIDLNGKDLYDMKFVRIRGIDHKTIKEYNDIYFDQLIPLFEEATGMYLNF